MNLLFISIMEGFPWGGSEELWYRTALKALDKQHKVMVIIKGWSEEPAPITALRQKGAVIIKRRIHGSSFRQRVLKKLTAASYTNNIFRAIINFKPGAILVSQGGTFDFFGDRTWWEFVVRLATPFSVISQSNLETGGILPESTIGRLQQNSRWFINFYFVSVRNLETAQRQAAFFFNNARIIDNPVNIKQAGIKKWPNQDILQIACVARYDCAYKGQDILIQALASPAFQHINYHLSLFGKGPDRGHLINLIKLYGLQNKITMHGHVTDIDLIWEKHHVLVLSSIAEGTPLALQECMLQGRPALVTDVGDCGRLIVDGETGLLMPSSSVKALEEGLNRLFATSQGQLKLMGENAYAKISSVLNLKSPAALLEHLCESKKG